MVPVLAYATGTLTIPNTIFTQPNPVPTSLLDQNWAAIATYVNAREITFGLLSARPTAGTAGRYYFATDNTILYADNGTSWTQIAASVSNQLVNQRASLTIANNGTATSSFLVFPGAATSDDGTIANRVLIGLTSTLTKKLTAWAVGSGNGCLDTGSVAAFTWYSVFVIQRPDTGVVDVLCSTSANSPTMPTNYTKKQRLGSIRTTWHGTAGAEIYFFAQYGKRFRWATVTSTLDVNSATPGTSAVVATLSTPNGVSTTAVLSCALANTGQLYVSEMTATDEAPAGPLSCAAFGGTAGGYVEVVTDNAQRIRYRNAANVATQLTTLGWEELWN
jgi:hypothetical protein